MMGGNVEATQRVAARALGVGSTTVDRAVQTKKKHEIRAPLTRTQKKYLLLLQRGYRLEIEKRSLGHVSKFFGAEIGGQEIKFDTAQRMIDQRLVEKVGEEDRTLKYEISPTAVQLLDSCREAHG